MMLPLTPDGDDQRGFGSAEAIAAEQSIAAPITPIARTTIAPASGAAFDPSHSPDWPPPAERDRDTADKPRRTPPSRRMPGPLEAAALTLIARPTATAADLAAAVDAADAALADAGRQIGRLNIVPANEAIWPRLMRGQRLASARNRAADVRAALAALRGDNDAE